ncbi:nucleotidyl transferase AbiEii/AbiGii toxin family protein [Arthrobacter citreus]|uniref:Nucleotidyl transferase AbiEii/AbiGii toxin family protein n=1 Tax=Arthrobacter citreus TaxID=1670 RepID=A0ABZ2ZUM1_9MICC
MSTPLEENQPEEIIPPKNVRYLERNIAERARAERSTVGKLKSLVANLVVCQMLPPSAVKGGTGLKLRLGENLTRQTPDLDTAFRGNMKEFEEQLRENLNSGWGDFTGAVISGIPRAPASVPAAYVMRPFAVKLQYRKKPFTTVELEVGFDELEATEELTETALSAELVETFVALGLPQPNPVPVLPLHHQVSQKLHACTEPGSQRAHDLVDLQLMEDLADDVLVAETVERLFRFRRQHEWPAHAVSTKEWETLYADAALGLEQVVLPTVGGAIKWLNDEYIPRIVAAGRNS